MDSIFPLVIHHFDLLNFKDLQNELIESAYSEKKKDPKGAKKSNLGGWQSNDIRSSSNNIITEELFKSIINYFHNNEILIKDSRLKFNNIWININGEGDSNIKHKHPGADLSGVFWIKSSNSGMLYFESPYSFIDYKSLLTLNPKIKHELAVWELMKYPPTEGKICIFPAFLDHWVGKNESKEDRISVSFNIELGTPPYAETLREKHIID